MKISKAIVVSIFLFVLFFSFSSCTETQKNTVNINIEKAEEKKFYDLIDSVNYLKLTDSGHKVIKRVNKIYFLDTVGLVVFDKENQQVLLFDQKGNFKSDLARNKSDIKPEVNIEDVACDFETSRIFLFCPFGYTIKAYDFQGYLKDTFAFKTAKLSGPNFEAFNRTLLFDRGGFDVEKNGSLGAVFSNPKLDLLKSFLAIPQPLVNYYVDKKKIFDVFNDSAYYIPSFYDTIFCFSKEKINPQPMYAIKVANDHWATNEKLEGKVFSHAEEVNKFLTKNKIICNFDRLTVLDNMIYFAFKWGIINYHILYNRNDGKTRVVKSWGTDKKNNETPFGTIISKYKNRFVGYILSDTSCTLAFYKLKDS